MGIQNNSEIPAHASNRFFTWPCVQVSRKKSVFPAFEVQMRQMFLALGLAESASASARANDSKVSGIHRTRLGPVYVPRSLCYYKTHDSLARLRAASFSLAWAYSLGECDVDQAARAQPCTLDRHAQTINFLTRLDLNVRRPEMCIAVVQLATCSDTRSRALRVHAAKKERRRQLSRKLIETQFVTLANAQWT